MNQVTTAPATQDELHEQGQALKGAEVLFDNNGATRVGKVIAHSIVGGSRTWRLQVVIAYRGGQYTRFVEDVAA